MRNLKSILLVEDDKDDQQLFVEALSEISNTSLYGIANDGVEALQQLNTDSTLPDMIFMDINMPRMNGIECLKEIIKSSHSKNIPVIILSTSTDNIELIKHLGGRAFLEKPTEYRMLKTHLEQMINVDFAMDHSKEYQQFTTITNITLLANYN
jgi:CheY-like chemotaxis protein